MGWPSFVFLGMEWLWGLCGLLCLAAAAALTFRPHLLSGVPDRPRLAWIVWGVCLPAMAVLFKLAQLRSFQLVWDSGVFANIVWNSAHGHGLRTEILGGHPYLGIHFALTAYLLAPLVWIWENTAVLAIAHGLAVGSAPLAVHLTARAVGVGAPAAWALSLLACGHPFFHNLLGAVLDNSVYAFPLFAWAAYCWESGRRRCAYALFLALLTTRELAPLLLGGWGLYILRSERRAGTALLIGAAALLPFELHVMHSLQSRFEYPWKTPWHLFSGIGGGRPWDPVWALILPPAKLWVVLRTLLSFALLPLAAGAALLPAAAAWLPNMLADAGNPLNRLEAHHSAFVFGPLLWAAARGATRLDGKRIVLPWLLVACGACFILSADFRLPPGMLPRAWLTSGPRALALVPAGADAWGDEFFLAHMAMRRRLWSLPRVKTTDDVGRVFEPEVVLLSTHWIRVAQPEVRDPVLRRLETGDFEKVFEEADLIVLRKRRI